MNTTEIVKNQKALKTICNTLSNIKDADQRVEFLSILADRFGWELCEDNDGQVVLYTGTFNPSASEE